MREDDNEIELDEESGDGGELDEVELSEVDLEDIEADLDGDAELVAPPAAASQPRIMAKG